MPQPKLIKISADGAQLPDDATEWVAVHLPDHGLTFTRTSVVESDVPHADCGAACKALSLAGNDDWDLPTIDELQLLIDRTRYSPATYTDYFDVESDWYWSKTPAAWSSASAWSVYFSSAPSTATAATTTGSRWPCVVPVSDLTFAHTHRSSRPMIILGNKVRDIVSGFEGIATARVEYLNGCVQFCIKPVSSEGKSLDAEYVDQQQLEVVDVGVADRIARKATGGPSSYAPPTRYRG